MDHNITTSLYIDHKYVKVEELTTTEIYTNLIDKNKNTPSTSKTNG